MAKNQSNKDTLIIFWTRLVLWIFTSCVVPIAIFANKFGLFEKAKYVAVYDELGNVIHKTPPALNGWGILSCLLIGLTIRAIIKEISQAYPGYSITKQILVGISQTIPLAIAFALCYYLEGVIDNVKYCLIVIILTRLIAIPLNPLPKWRFDKVGVANYNVLTSIISNYLKRRKVP